MSICSFSIDETHTTTNPRFAWFGLKHSFAAWQIHESVYIYMAHVPKLVDLCIRIAGLFTFRKHFVICKIKSDTCFFVMFGLVNISPFFEAMNHY